MDLIEPVELKITTSGLLDLSNWHMLYFGLVLDI